VTGLSLQSTDLASKRVEILREAVADLRRLAIMANVGVLSGSGARDNQAAQLAARNLGLKATIMTRVTLQRHVWVSEQARRLI
jgi:putative ABC transport system substrate-binding protein